MIQVRYAVDRLLREYAFLRTGERYRWQRLPVSVADRLLAMRLAVMVENPEHRKASHGMPNHRRP